MFQAVKMERNNIIERLCNEYKLTITYKDVDEDFICSICHELFNSPIIHKSCKNMFCDQCIKTLNKCPLCREDMNENTNISIIPNSPSSLITIVVSVSACRA